MIQQDRTEKEKRKRKKKKKMSHIKRRNMFKERERLRVDEIENGVLIQYKLSNRKRAFVSFPSQRRESVCVGVVGKKKEKRVKPHVDGVL